MAYGTQALRRPARLANRRGAAFLLAVYFASLMFLLLGGVSLQQTMTEIKSSQLSRDLHQAFWSAEGAFDQAITALRAETLPAFDALGCAYDSVQFDPKVDSRGNYMICKTANAEQFRVELLGTSLTSGPVWITSFIERKAPQITLTNAVVGLEDVTLSHAMVGGVNSANPATAPKLSTDATTLLNLAKGIFGTYDPKLSGTYNNKGHVATKSVLKDAMKILNDSDVIGKLLTGSAGVVLISQDSLHEETGSGATPTEQMDFPPVQTPESAAMLGDYIPESSRTVSATGVVTIKDSWAAVDPGVYRTNGLVIERGAFSTNGSVDLYVQGPLTVTSGALYGQVPGPVAEINTLKFSPPNLRIYVQPVDTTDKVRITKGSIVAGVLYAPQVPVRIDRKSLMMGAVVSKTAQIGLMPDEPLSYSERTNDKTQVFYDEAVGSQPISPSLNDPQAKVLYYSVHKSLTESSALGATEQMQMQKWFDFTNIVAVQPPTPVVASSAPGSGGGGGHGGSCFIATAAYGTPMAPEIQMLRTFRDEILLQDPLGRTFVSLYYRMSPPVARVIATRPWLRALVRQALTPVIGWATEQVRRSRTQPAL